MNYLIFYLMFYKLSHIVPHVLWIISCTWSMINWPDLTHIYKHINTYLFTCRFRWVLIRLMCCHMVDCKPLKWRFEYHPLVRRTIHVQNALISSLVCLSHLAYYVHTSGCKNKIFTYIFPPFHISMLLLCLGVPDLHYSCYLTDMYM
jgi:hypothetical protein